MSAVTTKAHHQLLITSSVRIIVGRLELLNINGILIFRPRYGAVMSMSYTNCRRTGTAKRYGREVFSLLSLSLIQTDIDSSRHRGLKSASPKFWRHPKFNYLSLLIFLRYRQNISSSL